MTLVAVAIPVDEAGDVDAALGHAASARRDGARLVEWRVDGLADRLLPEEAGEALRLVRRLVSECGAPSIVTVRSAAEGGGFRGEDADRVAFLEALGSGDPAPRYVDVELAVFERSANLRQKVRLAVAHERQPRDLKTSLILSAHDFDGRPPNLQSRLAAMVDEPACAVAKVAWRARSLRDDLEAFELLRERRKPMVALCMGEFGLMSRVLAPKFGGLFTFARGAESRETAAGQPTVRELFERWRFARIGAATRIHGVVGWPVGHSRSPDLHNAGFDAAGVDALFLPMPVEGSWESFKATVGSMIDFEPLSLRGLSVTIPHKEHLVRFVRERGGELCPTSRRCGSANTLIVGTDAARSLRAVNTDAPAAAASIEGAMGPIAGRRVAILGAGGVARALAVGAADAGAEVAIFNRSRERAEALVRELERPDDGDSARARFAAPAFGGSLDDAARAADSFDAFVNATPLGMNGEGTSGRSALPDAFPFRAGMVVMDTIYSPRETPLLRRARAAGAVVIDGSDMFIRQAEAQFESWTGRPPGAGLFRAVFERLESGQ